MFCIKRNGTYLYVSEDANLSEIFIGSSKPVWDDRSTPEACDSPPEKPVNDRLSNG